MNMKIVYVRMLSYSSQKDIVRWEKWKN